MFKSHKIFMVSSSKGSTKELFLVENPSLPLETATSCLIRGFEHCTIFFFRLQLPILKPFFHKPQAFAITAIGLKNLQPRLAVKILIVMSRTVREKLTTRD
jgi:hypothetical protein